MTAPEVIARTLCSIAIIDPDADSEHGTPNWHELRAQATAIHAALANAGFEIVRKEYAP